MKALLTIFVFPAFVLAKINIDITPASESRDPSVRFSGSVNWHITETDQEAFHVTDPEICSEKIILGYKKPRTVLVRANGDYDHKGLMVVLKPVRAEIISNEEASVVVASKEFNNHISVATVFKGNIKEEVTEVMSTSWSSAAELNSGKNICIRFGAGRIILDTAWKENAHHSTARAISNNSDLEMTLQPGQGFQAVLKATKASLQVKVDYEVSLEGSICVRYIWALAIPETKCWNVNEYLRSVNLPDVIKANETINVEYYYSPNVDVKDKNQIEGSYTLL